MQVLLDNNVVQVTEYLLTSLMLTHWSCLNRVQVNLHVHVLGYVRPAKARVYLGLHLQVRLVLGHLLGRSRVLSDCARTSMPPALLLLLDCLQAPLLVVGRCRTLSLAIVEEIVLVLSGLQVRCVLLDLLCIFLGVRQWIDHLVAAQKFALL